MDGLQFHSIYNGGVLAQRDQVPAIRNQFPSLGKMIQTYAAGSSNKATMAV